MVAMTRVVATSDTHGMLHEAEVPDGDILVLAGDILPNFYSTSARWSDAERQLQALDELATWVTDCMSHRKVVLVAGNHDWVFQLEPKQARKVLAAYPKIVYLEDAGAEILGVRFWGSPWQPEFCGWAFNLPRDGRELRRAWAKIPAELDVLVTHGPPHGILDLVERGERVGDALLLERVRTVKPRVHVFGHIHGSYGRETVGETEFLNVALCDESYMPVQRPLVLDLDERKATRTSGAGAKH